MMRVFCFLLCVILFSCNSKEYAKSSLEKDIRSYSEKLIKDKNEAIPTIDTISLVKMVGLVNKYIDQYPQDSFCVAALYKVADAYKAAHRPGLAIQYWGRVQREYPDSKFAPQALFSQAFTFENEIGDKENAKRYYEQFLQRFPAHPLAKDAEQLILLLGKSPEELLKQLEQNQAPNQ